MPNTRPWRASRWRSSSGHFTCVPGSRVGIAQRSARDAGGAGRRRRRSAASPPFHSCSAHAGASSARCRLVRKRRRSISVPSSAYERPRGRLRGHEHAALEVLDPRDVAAQAHGPVAGRPRARERSRGSPQPHGLAVGRVDRSRAAGLGGVDVADVGREGVGRAPGEQPRRLAGGQRPPRRRVCSVSTACARSPPSPRPSRRVDRTRSPPIDLTGQRQSSAAVPAATRTVF